MDPTKELADWNSTLSERACSNNIFSSWGCFWNASKTWLIIAAVILAIILIGPGNIIELTQSLFSVVATGAKSVASAVTGSKSS